MKHCNIALGVVFSGVVLTGCVFDEPAKEVDKPQIAAKVKTEAEIKLDKDLALAKFMFENKNDAKAFETFQKYAEQGNTEAEAWLGRCYMNGIGTPVNYAKAFEYFSKAAVKNQPYGINGLGVCKQYGYGTDIDLRAAIDYYKKAADMNFPLATLNLARSYSDKKDGVYDEKLAEEYFKKAVTIGAKGAKDFYASFLINRKRYDKAIPLLQGAKDFDSMMLLAQCYENGWGVKVDIKKALSIMEEAYRLPYKGQWEANSFYVAGLEELLINGQTDFARHCFKVGAEQGNRDCLYEYALILKKSGLLDEAIKYMMQAADTGYEHAQFEVAQMLKDKKDFTRAIKYFSLAALSERTKLKAVENLVDIFHELQDYKQKNHWLIYCHSLGSNYARNILGYDKLRSGTDENIALAAAWFADGLIDNDKSSTDMFHKIIADHYNSLRKQADQGNGNALFALGVLGIIESDKNPHHAIGLELLEKAIQQKSAFACNAMGNLHRDKEAKKAIEYYRQGAKLGSTRCAKKVVTLLLQEKSTSLYDYKQAFEQCLALHEYSILCDYARIMEYQAKDMKKAEELYRLAADKGDTTAMIFLHFFLLDKNSDNANDNANDDAWKYLLNAVNLENSYAELVLGDYRKLWDQPRDAYLLYLKSYYRPNKHAESAARLAECYLNGYGCDHNMEMFWKLAYEAYQNGAQTICMILGNVYRDGKICPRNLKKAREYYAEGVKRGAQNCQKALDDLK